MVGRLLRAAVYMHSAFASMLAGDGRRDPARALPWVAMARTVCRDPEPGPAGDALARIDASLDAAERIMLAGRALGMGGRRPRPRDDGVRRDGARGGRRRRIGAAGDGTGGTLGPRMARGHVGTPRRMRLRLVTLILAMLASAAVMTGCVSGSSTAGRAAAPSSAARFFSPSSVWNRRLPGATPVAADSRALVAKLRQVRSAGPWIATSDFSVPIVRVGARQKRVRVKLDTSYAPLQRDFASVPVPRDARPAPGSDRHLVVWQPATDTMWEFWLMQRKPRRLARALGRETAPRVAQRRGQPGADGRDRERACRSSAA